MTVDARDKRLRRLYNISAEEYDKILEFQNGVCPICEEEKNAKGEPKKLGVDHDHKSGLTRGILCFYCNRKLTEWWTPERLKAALFYLENPTATLALGQDRYGRKGRITNKRKRRRTVKRRATKR